MTGNPPRLSPSPIADIAGQTTLDFADFTGLSTPAEAGHVLAWRERMAARPSASA